MTAPVTLGALALDGTPVPRPARPWIVDLSVLKPYEGIAPGDVARFADVPDFDRWRLVDTPADPLAQLLWHAVEDGGRTLLVADRILLVYVSWVDLHEAGFVEGRQVTIDGQRFRCRLLGGGTDFSVAGDGYSGAAGDTEWDRVVAAGASETDRRGCPSEAVRLAPHNARWNWLGAHSWTADTFAGDPGKRVCRGYAAPQFFYLNTADHRHEDIGWRPALEACP